MQESTKQALILESMQSANPHKGQDHTYNDSDCGQYTGNHTHVLVGMFHCDAYDHAQRQVGAGMGQRIQCAGSDGELHPIC